jgi:hypothetical protein
MICRPDAGQHEQLRGIDRTSAQNYFIPRRYLLRDSVSQVAHTRGSPALKHDARRLGARHDVQV